MVIFRLSIGTSIDAPVVASDVFPHPISSDPSDPFNLFDQPFVTFTSIASQLILSC